MILGLFGLAALLGSVVSHAAPANSIAGGTLRAFLQQYAGSPVDRDLRFSSASVSLNEPSSRQVFVYLEGREWCGSGGCTALLLQPAGASFRVIDRFTLIRLPILILPSKTDGWHDIAMPVQGGGILDERMAVLRFNGHAYPENPSVAPRLPQKVADLGTAIPLSMEGRPVY